MEKLQHLLILCCYGGVPFIDYLVNNNHNSPASSQSRRLHSTRTLDPTDWIAIDSSGSLLNASVHPEILAANPHLADLIPQDSDVLLEQCDLYNLTFANPADEHLFELAHGALTCRCPRDKYGRSCQLSSPPSVQPQSTSTTISRTEALTTTEPSPPVLDSLDLAAISVLLLLSPSNATVEDMEEVNRSVGGSAGKALMLTGATGGPATFGFYIVLFLFFLVAMAGFFMMMRGCFCDCFGGFKNPFSSHDRYNRPIDPNALNRCLEAVRAHEQNEKNKYGVESRRPLISCVSETCPSYNPAPPFTSSSPSSDRQQVCNVVVPSAPPRLREHSPPPSYKSLSGSLETLPAIGHSASTPNNTRI